VKYKIFCFRWYTCRDGGDDDDDDDDDASPE
jgi:hypothetical protein